MTEKLIPLFAIGAFSAFIFSQAGMLSYWLKRGLKKNWRPALLNAAGATATGTSLIIIVITKFADGGWVTIAAAPILILLLHSIRRHYHKIRSEVNQRLELKAWKLETPVVVIPIQGWTRLAEKAVRLALLLSDDITAVHISAEGDNKERLKRLWHEKVEKPAKSARSIVPQLSIIDSPYRKIEQPIIDFIDKKEKENPARLIMVIIPELVEPHWYEYLLHNQHGTFLKTMLYLRESERTIIINCPWHLRDI